MGTQTPLYAMHVKAKAKMVDFAGWNMPLHYGSQIEEHHQVRKHAGMFDVSHMCIIDLHGISVAAFLRYLLANNIDKIIAGHALYTCMLNRDAGVIDDLIVYKINEHFFRVIVNAATREKDLAWIKQQARPFSVDMEERKDLVMLAVQGPEVRDKMNIILPPTQAEIVKHLKPFSFFMVGDWFIARTGYTGEDGYEIMFPAEAAEKVWQLLLSQSIIPCGLGARDTLRLEAGMNLYGADMDETVTPFESNLKWTVSMDADERDFIGRDRLLKQLHEGVSHQLVGLVLEGPGIIRNHQKIILANDHIGEVTSGGYSPTLQKSIALARIPVNPAKLKPEENTTCFVEIRDKKIPAQIVKPPFVRFGKKVF